MLPWCWQWRCSRLPFSHSEVTTEKDRETPEPISPDEIEIDVNYEPDPTDLVLSSVPGGELFDPRKHKFTEDELKPQPMIKKAKKVFVPEDQKVCDGDRQANRSVKFWPVVFANLSRHHYEMTFE